VTFAELLAVPVFLFCFEILVALTRPQGELLLPLKRTVLADAVQSA
jgi:hypothetical protein